MDCLIEFNNKMTLDTVLNKISGASPQHMLAVGDAQKSEDVEILAGEFVHVEITECFSLIPKKISDPSEPWNISRTNFRRLLCWLLTAH